MPKILLVDDEKAFRERLAARLQKRGFDVMDVGDGEAAIKAVRGNDDIEVVILDLKMPGMDGIQTLRELKTFRPALQAIMLTGHGSLDSAIEAGKLEVFRYLEKPCEIEATSEAIRAAQQEAVYARTRHELPQPATKRSSWWLGSHGSRPLFILIGVLLFVGLVLAPPPDRLIELLSVQKTERVEGAQVDANFGYAGYNKMRVGESVSEAYSRQYDLGEKVVAADGSESKRPLSTNEVASRAMVMLAIIVLAALFWASGAVPVGVTALLVGIAMYFFGVLKPDQIAQAYAKDAVIFVFGVLAMSRAITQTGLDRRIGLFLLAPARNPTLLLFVFLPMLSIACSFVSEHALVAFTMPLFVMVYASATRAAGLKVDKALMVMFALSLCYAANSGGPGSPAAGGRNAIMVGILSDYRAAPSFGEWVQYGLPMVPVLSFAIGLYFWLAVRPKVQVQKLDVAASVRRAAEKIGPMTRDEYVTGGVLLLVIALWITSSSWLGMGGPVILGLVLLNVLRVMTWKDMTKIHWEVVFLYGGASAIGKGLAVTGGALFLADGFVSVLPESMTTGSGLAIASSIFTGIATNFMSDGATVAAVGPVTVPMATIAGVHPWMVGFATAYASSFAHMMIIGTPSNALAFAMAKDPSTGEQLVTLGDFFKHGAAVLVLSFLVLWFWVILGYWNWMGFPPL